MFSSPTPVEPAAPTSLSTYSPAPMIGESPTRPGILNASPLVDVMPARSPLASTARQLIVPQRFSGHRSGSRSASGDGGGTSYAGTTPRFGGPQASLSPSRS